eukprot:3155523-Rhodomonas_salina.1
MGRTPLLFVFAGNHAQAAPHGPQRQPRSLRASGIESLSATSLRRRPRRCLAATPGRAHPRRNTKEKKKNNQTQARNSRSRRHIRSDASRGDRLARVMHYQGVLLPSRALLPALAILVDLRGCERAAETEHAAVGLRDHASNRVPREVGFLRVVAGCAGVEAGLHCLAAAKRASQGVCARVTQVSYTNVQRVC